MAKAQADAQVSVFDCDILRSAFIKTVKRISLKTNGGRLPRF
ncbi:hypothetical protein [Mesorhizobium sp.]|nr:hypothetical protein [Mesorhizobium sp.]